MKREKNLEFGESIGITIITKHGSMTRRLWLYFTQTNVLRRCDSVPHRRCSIRRSRSSPSPRHNSSDLADQIFFSRTEYFLLQIPLISTELRRRRRIFLWFRRTYVAGRSNSTSRLLLLLLCICFLINLINYELSWTKLKKTSFPTIEFFINSTFSSSASQPSFFHFFNRVEEENIFGKKKKREY